MKKKILLQIVSIIVNIILSIYLNLVWLWLISMTD